MQSQHAGLPNEYLILTDRVKYFEYANKHNAKEDRIAELEKKLTELQQKYDSERAYRIRDAEDYHILEIQKDRLETQKETVQKANHTLQLQVDDLQSNITQLQLQKLQLRSLDAASPEYKQMQEKYSTMQQEYSAMEDTTKKLHSNMQVTKLQMDTLLQKNLKYEETNSALQEKLNTMEVNYTESLKFLKNENYRVKEANGELTRENHALKQQSQGLNRHAEVDRLNAENRALAATISKLEKAAEDDKELQLQHLAAFDSTPSGIYAAEQQRLAAQIRLAHAREMKKHDQKRQETVGQRHYTHHAMYK